MRHRILISKRVTKLLQSLPETYRNQIIIKINLLSENPINHPKLDIKRIHGQDNLYRLRVGKIRIIFEIRSKELLVLIITAGSRGDIYKKI